MKKNRYEAPAIYTLKVELHHLMDTTPNRMDGTVYDQNGNKANDSGYFEGEDGPGDGETSDAKRGNYSPWTAWDDLPVWE